MRNSKNRRNRGEGRNRFGCAFPFLRDVPLQLKSYQREAAFYDIRLVSCAVTSTRWCSNLLFPAFSASPFCAFQSSNTFYWSFCGEPHMIHVCMCVRARRGERDSEREILWRALICYGKSAFGGPSPEVCDKRLTIGEGLQVVQTRTWEAV